MNRNLRIVFLGTPGFAVPALQFLLEAGYPVVGVVTAPDKTGGRGNKEILVPEVKKFALQHNLNILQPTNLKSRVFHSMLKGLKADLQVVVAFRMLPETVWNMPRLGTMNLHASLLPSYRGAAPINWAIINGETRTGLTTFLLRHEIDTGDIVAHQEMPILPEDNAGTLHDRMMYAGAGLVLGSIDKIASGNFETIAQDHARASSAPKINREVARINWAQPGKKVYDFIRGLSPYPGAWTMLDDREVKILSAIFSDSEPTGKPGEIRILKDRFLVSTEDGFLEILELQLSGKKRMSSKEFLKGNRLTVGKVT